MFGRNSLLALAADIGLSRDKAGATLDGDRLQAEMDADQRKLRALGGKGAVSGAQPEETFLQALRMGWEARPAILAGGGAVRGPDGCAI